MPRTTILKPCEVCGEPFETPPCYADRRRTCSRKCAGALRARERSSTKGLTLSGPCANCGQHVERRYGPAQARRRKAGSLLFCGAACQKEHGAAQILTLTCDRCGKTFERRKSSAAQRSRRSVYCSHACRDARVERTCKACGTVFHVAPGDLKSRPYRYCSRECFHADNASPWASHRDYLRHKRAEDPERFRTYVRNRRAKLMAAEGEHTAEEFAAKVEAYKGRCHWCGQKITGTPHADHLIALSAGGSNDIGNIVPSCAWCNTSKHAKMPWEFQEGRLL